MLRLSITTPRRAGRSERSSWCSWSRTCREATAAAPRIRYGPYSSSQDRRHTRRRPQAEAPGSGAVAHRWRSGWRSVKGNWFDHRLDPDDRVRGYAVVCTDTRETPAHDDEARAQQRPLLFATNPTLPFASSGARAGTSLPPSRHSQLRRTAPGNKRRSHRRRRRDLVRAESAGRPARGRMQRSAAGQRSVVGYGLRPSSAGSRRRWMVAQCSLSGGTRTTPTSARAVSAAANRWTASRCSPRPAAASASASRHAGT